LKPFTLALLSAALFGAATPASKALLADLSPFQLAGLHELLVLLNENSKSTRFEAPWRGLCA
jgi:hypothetical protein